MIDTYIITDKYDNLLLCIILGTEVCGILEYIPFGNTRRVQTVSLPPRDDALSDAIDVTFPIGNRIESQVQVGVLKA